MRKAGGRGGSSAVIDYLLAPVILKSKFTSDQNYEALIKVDGPC